MGSGWLGVLALCALAGPGAHSHGGDDGEAGAAGRAKLAEAIQKALEAQTAPQSVAPTDKERAFGIPFTVLEVPGLRVLTTSGDEEARRIVQLMEAARRLFGELTGTAAQFPSMLTAYALGTPEAKSAFLTRHPDVGPETSARLGKLEGSGIPGTADWAFWEGDAEKRLDAMVRFSFDWLCSAQGVSNESHPWLHEGLGSYLTHALVGTRLTWFERPTINGGKANALNAALASRMDEPGADWLELAREAFEPELKFDLEEMLHLELVELEPVDHLRAHALAAYLVEVHAAAVGSVLARVGAGEDPRKVLEEALGQPFDGLRERLGTWLEGRERLVAKAEGRRTPAELEAQWKRLEKERKRLAIEGFERRLAELDTAQLRWLRAMTAAAPAEIGQPVELPFFDPKVHAPAQPIARKRLGSADSRAKKLLKAVRPEPGPRAPVLVYDYDWGRAKLTKLGNPRLPETVFHNAVLGLPPGADLARALVLAALDHPSERKLQAAFSHAYTDREGNVFPVALYEMWVTGTTMEMPDVDALGVVHFVLDDWKRWVAPVPGPKQEPLYKLIGELFLAARRSRELRQNLADLYLSPIAQPRPGYETKGNNLQALWAAQDADPVRLAALLPDAVGWENFLVTLVQRSKQEFKFYSAGRRRAAQLRMDGEAVRKAMGAAMDEAETAELSPAEPAGEPGGR
jgi:hypothetical protein